MLINIFVWQAE